MTSPVAQVLPFPELLVKKCSLCGVSQPVKQFNERSGRNARRADCKMCVKRRNLAYRALHLEGLRQRDREYGRSNRPRKSATLKSWRLKNKEKQQRIARRAKLKKKYGITPERYQEMMNAQRGRCAVCGGLAGGNTPFLAVDHSHATGVVRGLLCFPCNKGIGHFYDNADVLEAAAKYLREHS